ETPPRRAARCGWRRTAAPAVPIAREPRTTWAAPSARARPAEAARRRRRSARRGRPPAAAAPDSPRPSSSAAGEHLRGRVREQIAVHAPGISEEALAHAGVEEVGRQQLQLGRLVPQPLREHQPQPLALAEQLLEIL